MIILYKFGSDESLGLPDMSPFVTKTETLLKMAGLPYTENIRGFRHAPKGKLPYIDDAGVIVADSTFIRWHLEQRYNLDFDAGLSARDRGLAWAVEKMLEDHLYWALMHARWNDDRNFERGPSRFFDTVPTPIRGLIKRLVRNKMTGTIKAQGMGRHTPAEIVSLAGRSLESLSALIGQQSYLCGEEPCGADATVFAFLSGALCPGFDTPIRTIAEAHANLVAYNDRMMRRYFPKLAPVWKPVLVQPQGMA